MSSYNRMRWWGWPALATFLVVASPLFAEDWPIYLKDPAHSSFNAAEFRINRQNVADLQASWVTKVNAELAAGITVSSAELYFGAWDGNFYAVDGRSGNVRWRQFVGMAAEPAPECPQAPLGVTAQAAVDANAVYVGGGDSAVYALDRATGAVRWRVPLADPMSGSYLWSSLTLYKNALYVGVASLGDCPLVRGALARIDLAAPLQPKIAYFAPEDAEGGGIWSTPAIDVETNTVFVTTGTGEQDAELGLWGGTLAALDAETLKMQSYFFLPTNSVLEDIEWGSSPALITTDHLQLVVATGKDGILYALNRSDLSLVWTARLAVGCICPECGCGSLSTPAFDGKTIFVGAGVDDIEGFDAGTVYAIDPASGSTLWKKTTPGVVIAPVTLANGLVYVSTTQGLNIFDAQHGDLLWTDGYFGVLFSQPIVVDGTVYCTYLRGDVVAWRLPEFQSGPIRPLSVQHDAVDSAGLPYGFSRIGAQQQMGAFAALNRARTCNQRRQTPFPSRSSRAGSRPRRGFNPAGVVAQ